MRFEVTAHVVQIEFVDHCPALGAPGVVLFRDLLRDHLNHTEGNAARLGKVTGSLAKQVG